MDFGSFWMINHCSNQVPEGTTLGKDAKDSIAAAAKIFIHHIATL